MSEARQFSIHAIKDVADVHSQGGAYPPPCRLLQREYAGDGQHEAEPEHRGLVGRDTKTEEEPGNVGRQVPCDMTTEPGRWMVPIVAPREGEGPLFL